MWVKKKNKLNKSAEKSKAKASEREMTVPVSAKQLSLASAGQQMYRNGGCHERLATI